MKPQEVVIVGRTGGFPFWRTALLAAVLVLVALQGGLLEVDGPVPAPDVVAINDVLEGSAKDCGGAWTVSCSIWYGDVTAYDSLAVKFRLQLGAGTSARFGWLCDGSWRHRQLVNNPGSAESAWISVGYSQTSHTTFWTEPAPGHHDTRCTFSAYVSSSAEGTIGSLRIADAVARLTLSEDADPPPAEPVPADWDPSDPPPGWCYEPPVGGPGGHPGTWYEDPEGVDGDCGATQTWDYECTVGPGSHDQAGNGGMYRKEGTGPAFTVTGHTTYTIQYEVTKDRVRTDTDDRFGFGLSDQLWSIPLGVTLNSSGTFTSSVGASYHLNLTGVPRCTVGAFSGSSGTTMTAKWNIWPTSSGPPTGSSGDADGDGYGDHYEGVAGSDPNDPESTPENCCGLPELPPGAGGSEGDGDGNDFEEFCDANPGKAACRDGNPFGEFCATNPDAGACDEDNPLFEWCTGGGAETALCNPEDTPIAECGGPGCTGTTGDGNIGTGLGSGMGVGDTAWTDGACVDINPKMGSLTLIDLEPAQAPGSALDVPGWLAYIAGLFTYMFGWLLNLLGSVWNLAVDLVVPSACFLESVTAFVDHLGGKFPFSLATSLLGSVDNGVSKPDYDWSFTVADQVITVPLSWAAGMIAPLRPLLVSAVWAGFGWNTLGWLFSIVGPDPRSRVAMDTPGSGDGGRKF